MSFYFMSREIKVKKLQKESLKDFISMWYFPVQSFEWCLYGCAHRLGIFLFFPSSTKKKKKKKKKSLLATKSKLWTKWPEIPVQLRNPLKLWLSNFFTGTILLKWINQWNKCKIGGVPRSPGYTQSKNREKLVCIEHWLLL